ncbi:hypothetical protein GIB67_005360 [Kingdonia uniflora]|uniref:VHS domain-containing protein n=1 Tax=Kingdonia uniflora TaxID=39325 RepID=A0A7J7NCL9_9MAGN|nr:hypothetical protein GIB67_005360 [Kingdonia uniflora]
MTDVLMEKVSAFGEQLKINSVEVGQKVTACMNSMSFKMKKLFNSPNQADKIVEDATSKTLNDPNWEMNLEICDLIYSEKINSIVELIREVAKENGLLGASLFSQLGSVNYIFYQVSRRIIGLPFEEIVSSVPGLLPLEISELPTFVSDLEVCKVALDLYLGQFSNPDKANSVVFSTFDKLESKETRKTGNSDPKIVVQAFTSALHIDSKVREELTLHKPRTVTEMIDVVNNYIELERSKKDKMKSSSVIHSLEASSTPSQRAVHTSALKSRDKNTDNIRRKEGKLDKPVPFLPPMTTTLFAI